MKSLGARVLVVDDAGTVRRMVCAMLAQSGYAVLEAASGNEALRILNDSSETIHLVLTDVVMPEMTGAELAQQLAHSRPELPVIFMSGYNDDPMIRRMEQEGTSFLAKPFTTAVLVEKVRQVLSGSGNSPTGLGCSPQ
jgi:two-component system cell cycle sensor histidine kinase/response regulator CckA